MSLEIKNTRDLADPSNFRLKMLVYGPSGVGKSPWALAAPKPGVAAFDTGLGRGLAGGIHQGVDYIEPSTYQEYEQFCSGHVFKDHETLILDNATDLYQTVIKDDALAIPRAQGSSPKRLRGIPELDDYNTMGESCRRTFMKLLGQPKHIVVIARMDYYQPFDAGPPPKKESPGGPDLPGQMKLACTAMFDVVVRLWNRQALRDPKDPKSRYSQRFFTCEGDEKYVARSRFSFNNGQSIYPPEVIWDSEKGQGTWQWFYDVALKHYTEFFEAQKVSSNK